MAEIGSLIPSFDVGLIVQKIYFFAGIFFLVLFFGILIGAFFILRAKNKRQVSKVKIGWWHEVVGTQSIVPDRMDEVEEIVVPGTFLRLFYCKKRDSWLPRFSKGITKDLYYVLLTPNQEIINFTLKAPGKEIKEAGLDMDHTDMRFAAENMRDFVKRNYKDKSQKWWQLYKSEIATWGYILVLSFGFILIIYFMRGLVEDIGAVMGQAGQILQNSCIQGSTSGIAAAPS